MRRVLFWLHLTAGCVASLVILIMSVTGILLAYERPLVRWLSVPTLPESIPPQGSSLRLETLMRGIAQAAKSVPSTVTVYRDPKRPVEAAFGRERILYFDPYTGAMLGRQSPQVAGFFRQTENWHRWLGMSGIRMGPARAATGACNLAFGFLVLSGVVLWWPRNFSWQNARRAMRFRSGLRGRARNWNWHTVTGFWFALPLAYIVLTGVVMSYSWANSLLFRLTGSPVPLLRGRLEALPSIPLHPSSMVSKAFSAARNLKSRAGNPSRCALHPAAIRGFKLQSMPATAAVPTFARI